jgi:hypothetical protein
MPSWGVELHASLKHWIIDTRLRCVLCATKACCTYFVLLFIAQVSSAGLCSGEKAVLQNMLRGELNPVPHKSSFGETADGSEVFMNIAPTHEFEVRTVRYEGLLYLILYLLLNITFLQSW